MGDCMSSSPAQIFQEIERLSFRDRYNLVVQMLDEARRQKDAATSRRLTDMALSIADATVKEMRIMFSTPAPIKTRHNQGES